MLGLGGSPWQFVLFAIIFYLNLKDSGLWTASASKQASAGSGMADEFRVGEESVSVSSGGMSFPVSDDSPKLSRRKSLQADSMRGVSVRNVHIMFCQS